MIKPYKLMILLILSGAIFTQSYPQVAIKAVDNYEVGNNNIVDKVLKEKTDYLDMDIVYPQIKGVPQEKIINLSIDKIINDTVREVKDVIKVYYGKGEPKPVGPFQLYSRYQVTNRDKILSFYFDLYQFTGGAHGITTRHAYNIDMITGEIKTLDNLFSIKSYKEIIDEEINRQIKEKSDEFFHGKEGFQGVDKNTKFYIDNENLTIYYQEYEIAPYVKGIPEFKVSLKLLK